MRAHGNEAGKDTPMDGTDFQKDPPRRPRGSDLGLLLTERLAVHEVGLAAAAAIEGRGCAVTSTSLAAEIAAHPFGASDLGRPDYVLKGMLRLGWLVPGDAPFVFRLTDEGRRLAAHVPWWLRRREAGGRRGRAQHVNVFR